LDNIKHRLNKFKIQINAKENNLTGNKITLNSCSIPSPITPAWGH